AQRKIEIIEDFDDVEITGDKDLIFKALLFLIRNAIDHSVQNGKIEIKVKKETDKVVISILDYGKGFSDEVIKNIYSPYRFNEEEFHKNNELSIYLVKLIMDYHQGELKVYNKSGAGAFVELVFNQ
ncbi:MAG: ATP-binding protein, partial [Bacteroidales bacterium]